MDRVVWIVFLALILGSCETTGGILKYPPACSDEDCSFYLQWMVANKSQIDFDLRIKTSEQDPWVAVGLGEQQRMSDTSVVECLYQDGKITVQASYNSGHKNQVLQNPHLGIVGGSTSGGKTDTRLTCRFSRVVRVDPRDPEADKVKNLDEPHFVLMATGRVKDGVKKKHQNLYISSVRVNFLNEATGSSRSPYLVAHGVVMTLVWLVLLNFTTLVSRYFKDDWLQGLVMFWRPVWFQAHRFCAFFSASLIVISVLIISSYRGWIFYASTHSILGLTVVSLVALNLLSGMLRPNPDSRFRKYFRYFHGSSGHIVNVVGCVTLYFGLSHPQVFLPLWVTWLPIGYLVFRLWVDLILTVLISRDANVNSYSHLVEHIDPENETWSWRYAIAIAHIIISVGLSLVIVIALAVHPAKE